MNLPPLFPLAALVLVTAAHAADRPLQIDPAHSRVEIDVKATVDSFTGRLETYEAVVLVTPGTAKITGATFRFRFADLRTGKAKRDRKMLDWAGTGRHPDGLFELVSLDPSVDGRSTARGRLTLHGVTQPIAFPVTVLVDQEVFSIDGEVVVDHRLFDLPVIRMAAVLKVDPVVKVRFHLQGRPAGD